MSTLLNQSMNSLIRLLQANTTSSSQCELFGAFGYIVQAILGVIAFLTLVAKRFLEKPRRPWKIWFFDASKQLISACLIHMLNLLLSVVLTNKESADECVWYFLTLLLDTTLGVFITYIIMWFIDGIAKACKWQAIRSGLYFKTVIKNEKKRLVFKPKMYFAQLGVFIMVTLIVRTKSFLLILQKICRRFLENFGNFFLSPLTNGKVKLLFVMILIPMILNSVYFWIVDNILKLNPEDADKEITEIYLKETTSVERSEVANKPSSSIELEMPSLNEKIQANSEGNEGEEHHDTEEILIASQITKTEEQSQITNPPSNP